MQPRKELGERRTQRETSGGLDDHNNNHMFCGIEDIRIRGTIMVAYLKHSCCAAIGTYQRDSTEFKL